MSKRTNVLFALRDLFANALTDMQVEVIGLDGSEAAPTRPRAAGRMLIATGDPGEPQVDLSPLAYNYDHGIPVALMLFGDVGEDGFVETFDRISDAINGDRTLGGRCDWCEPTAPTTEGEFTENGAVVGRSAEFFVVASYVTASPLS
ncbi:hypothetical protein ASE70_15050 [Sphingomonas sp. Leaf22]|uniref:hypothetical protein n=1 Tax=Sphingomonas sp. Leaf22 TaxID=1735687 RepID=UPI0006F9C60D|nr:hypothetical protein [Sphingomonas sp. Leaf22]KQM92229.1 hypothetical protein ASE70_15050 [Sphingomonas sp. Leaf22]